MQHCSWRAWLLTKQVTGIARRNRAENLYCHMHSTCDVACKAASCCEMSLNRTCCSCGVSCNICLKTADSTLNT